MPSHTLMVGADMERDYPEIDAAITKAERARSA